MIPELKRDFEFDNIKVKNFINLSEQEHLSALKWRNEETVRKMMFSEQLIEEKDHFKFIEGLKSNSKNSYWRVDSAEKGAIGVIYLNDVDESNRHAYLGLYANLGNTVSGKGDMLMSCLERIAFDYAKLHSLKLEVLELNSKAISLYNKCGFQKEGTLKDFVLRDDKWIDTIVMGKIVESKR